LHPRQAITLSAFSGFSIACLGFSPFLAKSSSLKWDTFSIYQLFPSGRETWSPLPDRAWRFPPSSGSRLAAAHRDRTSQCLSAATGKKISF
ncbi:MAG: hypothetical protein NTU44_10065, partial [Bacteroidetes bacterium]|nr:hypothetical protein [Bacteroidota bacterium]